VLGHTVFALGSIGLVLFVAGLVTSWSLNDFAQLAQADHERTTDLAALGQEHGRAASAGAEPLELLQQPRGVNLRSRSEARRRRNRTSPIASTSMESPVRSERRAPRSVRGARKPARAQRLRQSAASRCDQRAIRPRDDGLPFGVS
jgi:hypothetical protein